MPMNFVSLDDFHRRKLRPGEAITLYALKLRKLLIHAIPDMAAASKEPLLLHQFLSGIPESMSRQLRASGEIKTLDKAIRLLMTIEPEQVAMLWENPCVSVGKPNEIQMLREQVAAQTEQVAALTEQVVPFTIKQSRTRQESRRPPCCFNCNQIGHLLRDCRNQGCFFSVGNWAISPKIVSTREMPTGHLYRAAGVPTIKP